LKIYKSMQLNLLSAPPLAVVILLLSKSIPLKVAQDGIIGNNLLAPYNIMILFISLAYLGLSVQRTGLLKFLAFKISTQSAQKSPLYLLTKFYVFSLVISSIIGNAPVILASTGFLIHFTTKSRLDPIPFVFTEFYSSNLGSLVLFAGDPTNLLIIQAFQTGYLTYSKMIILPFLGCAIVCYLVSVYQFRDMLAKLADEERVVIEVTQVLINLPRQESNNSLVRDHQAVQIQEEDVSDDHVLNDPVGAIFGSAIFISCIITLIITSFLDIPAWIVSISFTIPKIIFDIIWDCILKSPGHIIPSKYPIIKYLFKTLPTLSTTITALPFDLVIFSFSQFILIEALAYHSWIDTFAGILCHLTIDLASTVIVIGILIIILSVVMGTNITATIFLARVILAIDLTPSLRAGAWVSLALGSNVAAINLTVSSSLSGLLWQKVLQFEGLVVDQKTFQRYNWRPLGGMIIIGFGIVYLQALL
jgi:Na+/H+ antiporter NhaD/arsenite permease-like protein